MQKLTGYPTEIEEQMKNLYQSLSEKEQRRYAAIEAKKLGYGGISYICRLFGCDPSSVKHGLSELENPLASTTNRIRKAGGGLDVLPRVNSWDSGIDSECLYKRSYFAYSMRKRPFSLQVVLLGAFQILPGGLPTRTGNLKLLKSTRGGCYPVSLVDGKSIAHLCEDGHCG